MSKEQEIQSFLAIAANIGYASETAAITKFPDGGHQVVYEVGDKIYEDYWWGGHPFAGQESITFGGRVIWAAQYRGWLENNGPERETYSFLRQALRAGGPDDFYRGPAAYKDNGWRYTNDLVGDLQQFEGEERIFSGRKHVYTCKYMGGLVAI